MSPMQPLKLRFFLRNWHVFGLLAPAENVQKKIKKSVDTHIVFCHSATTHGNTNYKHMRTKTLVCAAALAAGALTSWAQSNVYSLNVVGYVNVVFPPGQFTVFANPLNNANNAISNIFPT